MPDEYYIGLGKVKYTSSVSTFRFNENEKFSELEVFLTERVGRRKNSGEWPWRGLEKFVETPNSQVLNILENRDVEKAREYEDYLNSRFPFYDFIKNKKLQKFVTKFNQTIKVVDHHLAHASMAHFFSPFGKTLVWVLDGAGSRFEEGHEYDSLYSLNHKELRPLEKKLSPFTQNEAGKWISDSPGIVYETVSEYVFGSKLMSGKLMGLAPFGETLDYIDSQEMLENLNWDFAFKGKNKKEWELSPQKELFANLAATTQSFFERYVLKRVKGFEINYPEYENLILVGGCALNCTCNQKIVEMTKFKNLYVPPSPGDSGISIGLAYLGLINAGKDISESERSRLRTTSLGPCSSVPTSQEILSTFKNYEVIHLKDLTKVCDILKKGEVIAWFQGRSEIGPRALGNRSLLASVERKGLKDHLNNHVKFRESFRPYGCSVLKEKASEYFDIAKDFENPYMSFAVRVKEDKKELLKEVMHIDGTSRMQTVGSDDNIRYHELLKLWGESSGHPVLLNTSLNIMGEPILENINDAFMFMQSSSINYMVIEDYLVIKK
jgi:carbamoyltransferase